MLCAYSRDFRSIRAFTLVVVMWLLRHVKQCGNASNSIRYALRSKFEKHGNLPDDLFLHFHLPIAKRAKSEFINNFFAFFDRIKVFFINGNFKINRVCVIFEVFFNTQGKVALFQMELEDVFGFGGRFALLQIGYLLRKHSIFFFQRLKFCIVARGQKEYCQEGEEDFVHGTGNTMVDEIVSLR